VHVRPEFKEPECLATDTPARYAATRARVEARATLEQAEELRNARENRAGG
jgi:hypothetical protein